MENNYSDNSSTGAFLLELCETRVSFLRYLGGKCTGKAHLTYFSSNQVSGKGDSGRRLTREKDELHFPSSFAPVWSPCVLDEL